jgi:ketosteroid isomerase-like protein
MSAREIEQVIRTWEKAIQSGDVEVILENHTQDVLMFDVPEPMQSKGIEAYRDGWELFFRYGEPGPEVFVIENLNVTAGNEVAFATGLLHIGSSTAPICRLTLGLKLVRDRWLIAHEHHSAPHDLQSQTDA